MAGPFDFKTPTRSRSRFQQKGGGSEGLSTLLGLMYGEKIAGDKAAATKQAQLDVENKQIRNRVTAIINDMDTTMDKIPDLSPQFGRLGGIGLNLAAKSGFAQDRFPELAEVEAWNGAKKAFSRIIARAFGEQRITDLDRDDFIEIINSPESTSQERLIKTRRLKQKVSELFGPQEADDLPFVKDLEGKSTSPIPGSPSYQGKNDDPLGVFTQ